MNQTPDEQLLSLFVDGQHRAFEVLVMRYQGPIYGFVLRYCGDREAARDLAQEVFLRVVRRAATFSGRSTFKTWLYTIARNLCTDHARRATHRRIVQLDRPSRSDEGARESRVERAPDRGPGPDRLVDAHRARDVMRVALEALPNEQREVFLMREHQGLTFADIAQVVQVPLPTVKSRMRYALTALRLALVEFKDVP